MTASPTRTPTPTPPLNVREAAYALSVSLKTINQAFDRAKLSYVRIRGRQPRKKPRTVRVPDLLAYALQEKTSALLTFTKAGKAALQRELQSSFVQDRFADVEAQMEALRTRRTDPRRLSTVVQETTTRVRQSLQTLELSIGPVRVAVGDILTPIVTSLAAVAASRSAVTCDQEIRGGEPVVSGTRIPVYMLADLRAQGVEDDVLLADYPSLTPELLTLALLYTRLHRPVGRPKPLAAPWRMNGPLLTLASGATRPNQGAKKSVRSSLLGRS